jgi:hypothetical protein
MTFSPSRKIEASEQVGPSRLLDTNSNYDAMLCGYGAACDPVEDGEGLVIEASTTNGVHCASIVTGTGSAELIGVAEIRATIHALQSVLAGRV